MSLCSYNSVITDLHLFPIRVRYFVLNTRFSVSILCSGVDLMALLKSD